VSTLTELRAFEAFDHVPAGCKLVLVTDDSNKPHLREGEFAVVDMCDTAFVSGELYLIGWKSGHVAESICQVIERTMERGLDGKPFQGIWFCPLNRPQRLEDIEHWRGPLYASDGPLKPQYLPEYLKGRVIGVFVARDASIALPTRPLPRRGTEGSPT
jgi:hypothetical protein